MMSALNRRLAGCLLLCVLIIGCSAGPKLSRQPDSSVDLSGNWLMDREQSDDIEVMMRDAFAAASAKKSGRKPPDSKRPPRDGGRRPGDERDRSVDSRSDQMAMTRPDELVFADLRMVIKQSPGLVEVTSKRAGYRRYKIGIPVSRTGPGGSFEVNSGWNGTDFYAVSEGRGGMDVVERYSLAADGSELAREVTVESKFLDDPVVARQIYRPE